MNLGFQDQFVPLVEDGSKTHSIRAGERWKVGMRADLYAKPRQKGMRLIFRAPVVRVERIEIIEPFRIFIDGVELDSKERKILAWRDGFRPSSYANMASVESMAEFWRGRTPFHGQIVHWDYAARFMDIRETCFRESARRAMEAAR